MANVLSVQLHSEIAEMNETITNLEQDLKQRSKELAALKELRNTPKFASEYNGAGGLEALDDQLRAADEAAQDSIDVIADAKNRRDQAIRIWFQREKDDMLRRAGELEAQAAESKGRMPFMERLALRAEAKWLRLEHGGVGELRHQIQRLTGLSLEIQ